MIEINLVPDVKQELIKAQRVRSTVITASILIGLASIAAVALLAIYVFAVQAVRSGNADEAVTKEVNILLPTDEAVKKDSKLLSVDELYKMLTLQNQLTKISALNDSKKIDSRIFDVLNAIIPPAPNDIQISSLTVDSATGAVAIEGQAPNSYAAVEIFKKTIDGAKLRYTDVNGTKQEIPLASNINTSNTSYGEDSSGAKVLRFTLSFVYTPELFSPASKNTTIAITVNGNVTDSYLGLPKSIFVDKPAKDIDIKGGQ